MKKISWDTKNKKIGLTTQNYKNTFAIFAHSEGNVEFIYVYIHISVFSLLICFLAKFDLYIRKRGLKPISIIYSSTCFCTNSGVVIIINYLQGTTMCNDLLEGSLEYGACWIIVSASCSK